MTTRYLITGATGTFGQAMIARLLGRPEVERVVCFSRDELKQSQLADRFPDPRLRCFLGDVRDQSRLEQAMWGIQAVIHAAALKRVDAVAYDSEEALKTNVLGTINVVKAAVAAGVPSVVLLSSDKAVEATNFYGASKFMAEQAAIAANAYAVPRGTRIAVTRYGNVLGSRGSVLHRWRAQVNAEQPITVTDPSATRFWMTIEQAVDLVVTALERMDGGEIFLPKLPAAGLTDIAAALAGHEYPTSLIGLRPGGEKLHESLLSSEEVSRTHDAGDVFVIAPSIAPWRSGSPDYGPLVSRKFVYRSDSARQLSVEQLRPLVEAAA